MRRGLSRSFGRPTIDSFFYSLGRGFIVVGAKHYLSGLEGIGGSGNVDVDVDLWSSAQAGSWPNDVANCIAKFSLRLYAVYCGLVGCSQV